jgi:hypothetical protein
MDGVWIDGPASRLRQPTRLALIKGFCTPGRILILAISLVVVLVSLPLLRSLALRSNELDALRTLDLLGREVFAAQAGTPSMGQLFREDGELVRRLPDRRLLVGGRLMFHHGYLFEVVPAADGAPALRAWPLAHGETGLGAFSSFGKGLLLGHPNRSARWSGVSSAPPLPFSNSRPDPLPDSLPDPSSGTAAGSSSEAPAGWRAVRISEARSSGM